MAEADRYFIQVQKPNAKEDADADVVVQAGDADLAADIEADGLLDQLGHRFMGSAGNRSLFGMRRTDDALPLSRHNCPFDHFRD